MQVVIIADAFERIVRDQQRRVQVDPVSQPAQMRHRGCAERGFDHTGENDLHAQSESEAHVARRARFVDANAAELHEGNIARRNRHRT